MGLARGTEKHQPGGAPYALLYMAHLKDDPVLTHCHLLGMHLSITRNPAAFPSHTTSHTVLGLGETLFFLTGTPARFVCTALSYFCCMQPPIGLGAMEYYQEGFGLLLLLA